MNKFSKRFCSLTLAVVLTVVTIPTRWMPNTVNAENLQVSTIAGTNFEYTYLDDGTIELTKWTGRSSGVIEVPESFNEVKITSIGRFAFYNCDKMTGITLPDTITNIGEYAFSGCESLKEIVIPDSVVNIQSNAFASCSDLQTVKLPSELTVIADWSFAYCSNLTSIQIPSTVAFIGERAFLSTALKEIELSDTVSVIKNKAFSDCDSLAKIIILNNSCDIFDEADTISDTASIVGYANSTAQSYADKYERNFAEYDFQPPTETSTSTTTTTTSKATTTTTTTTTTKASSTTSTTTTTTNTTTVVPSRPTTFTEGSDNWRFPNSRDNFGNTYYMSDKYWNALLNGLSNTEKATMNDYVKNEYWGGSCYGMAATSILACHNILKPNQYQNNAKVLHDISAPPSNEVKSLINYYFALQYTDVIQQEICRNFYNDNEKEKLQTLIACLEDGSPTLLCFHGYFYQFSWGGHAVVAYDVEYGSYSYNGRKYDGKIVTYDNNSVDYDDDFCLYFSTSDWSWYIPYYELNSNWGSLLGLITDDLKYINYHGYLNGTSSSTVTDYIAVLHSAALTTEYNIEKVNYQNGMWMSSDLSDDDVKRFSSFADNDFENCDIMFAMKDAKSGYVLTMDEPQTLDVSLSYEHSFLTANATSSNKIRFSPEGYIEMNGQNAYYDLGIVLDGEYTTNDWYGFNVTGEGASNVSFECFENGYILKSNNLNNVLATGYNDYVSTNVSFSTDYTQVYLYEIDEYTMGVAVDSDKNGTYETIIAKSSPGIEGDINNDSIFSVADVVTMQRWLLNDGTRLVNWKNADLCEDGKLDVFDLCMMKRKLINS